MAFRKIVPALLLCSLLWPHTALAQRVAKRRGHTDKAASVEKEILRFEELGRQKALRGESNWDDLTADGAYLIQGDGTVMVYRPGQNLSSMSLTSFKLSDLIVRVYGQTAVATGLSEVESETPDKRTFSFRMRYLNVWKKTAGGWKIVAAERTMVRPYTK
ncbi:MAG: nuclear transport factor 2 family protein [Acidobacteria bacterium]|nr:nuclear transport factor 2 family protein [Acidobacteriota bacterium]